MILGEDQMAVDKESETGLFGVRHNIVENVRISFNCEIEPPVPCYSGLPDSSSFVVLFGAERRVAEVQK